MPPHTTKPVGVGGAERVEDVAIGAPRADGGIVPNAAAQHPRVPCSRSGWSGWVYSRRLPIRRPIPIPAPLQHIPSHIVETVAVRRKIPHRTRIGKASGIEVRVVAIVWPQIVAIAVGVSNVVGLAFGNRVAPRKALPTQIGRTSCRVNV